MPGPFADGPLREAMRHLFNSDPESGCAALAGYLDEFPDDPLAHALHGAVRFYHDVSLHISRRDTKSIVGVLLGPGIAMPRALQKEIGSDLRRARTLAAKLLATHAGDAGALLALCVVEGVNRDGLALVSKRWSASIEHAQRAYCFARRLLEHEPLAYDAHFVFGSTEYLVSRIPAPVRPFVDIPGVTGDRRKAIGYCQIAAKSGLYFRELASRALVNLYLEDDRPAEALSLLGELADEFPGNRTLRADWIGLQARAGRK
jgi:hypothetical protein